MHEVLVRYEELRLFVFAVGFQHKHTAPHVVSASLPHEVLVLPRLIAGRVHCGAPGSDLRASPQLTVLGLLVVILGLDHHKLRVHGVREVVDLLHLLIVQSDLLEVVEPEGVGVLEKPFQNLFVTLLGVIVVKGVTLLQVDSIGSRRVEPAFISWRRSLRLAV